MQAPSSVSMVTKAIGDFYERDCGGGTSGFDLYGNHDSVRAG